VPVGAPACDPGGHGGGAAGRADLHRAGEVPLVGRRGRRPGEGGKPLGHRVVRGGGQNGHHLVVGVEQQGVCLGGILDRDLGQGLVGVEGGLHRKAAVYPVDQLGGLVKGGAAGGVAVGVGAVRHPPDAEDIGL